MTGSGYWATSPVAESSSVQPRRHRGLRYIANVPSPGSYTIALEAQDGGSGGAEYVGSYHLNIVQLAASP